MNETRCLNAFNARLRRIPRAGSHPALRCNPRLEGYFGHVFGGRAGPSIQISNTFHELGHAVDFGADQFNQRAPDGEFVFRLNEIFVYDRICVEPTTYQGIERECRTIAYQIHLMESTGKRVNLSNTILYWAKCLEWLPDWYNIPHQSNNINDRRLDRIQWCCDRIVQEYQSVTQDWCIDRLVEWLDCVLTQTTE